MFNAQLSIFNELPINNFLFHFSCLCSFLFFVPSPYYFIRTTLYAILMLMDSQLPPPAPPPMQPVTPTNNPYDFITQPNAPKKRGLLPQRGSKKQKVLIIAGLVFVLLCLAGLV